MSAADREFDVVVWGATGFTGKLVAEYLLGRHGAGGDLRWALGGRNQAKLEQVRSALAAETATEAAALPLVLGDSLDLDSMRALAERTRVVCTTVGPYGLYGSPLVEACADRGTHACDLTGEVYWMQRMLEAHGDRAEETGARIVHTCGFDSIPSDLGVFFLQREMQSRHGVACSQVKVRIKGFSGGASGGTVASMLSMMDEAERDPEVLQAMNEPYSLNPKDQRSGPDGPDTSGPVFDADFAQWTAPFMMAGINTKVVRRTNALLDYAYGKSFRYDETMLTGAGAAGWARAFGVAASMRALNGATRVGALRRAFAGFLPSPGEGPSKEKREAGYFDIRLLGVHPTDPQKNLAGRVTGDRDPGYGSTAKMLGESAVCLAQDPLAVGGGFWTPAAVMGEPLLARLQAFAGLTFSTQDSIEDSIEDSIGEG